MKGRKQMSFTVPTEDKIAIYLPHITGRTIVGGQFRDALYQEMSKMGTVDKGTVIKLEHGTYRVITYRFRRGVVIVDILKMKGEEVVKRVEPNFDPPERTYEILIKATVVGESEEEARSRINDLYLYPENIISVEDKGEAE